MSVTRRTGRFVGQTLLNLAALGGAICIALVILAFAFNISLIMFKTGSMSPTIPAGSVALVREIPASEIQVGDVVTVARADALPVTHRVTSVDDAGDGESRTITMRGDANEAADPHPYTVTEVRRVLFSIPGVAHVIVAFSHPLVLGALTVGATVLVTWAFWPKQARRERPVASSAGSGAALAITVAFAIGLAGPAPDAQATGFGSDASFEETIESTYLTLTSIGDRETMRSMTPGVAVPWQVGVRVEPPDSGRLEVALAAAGSDDVGLEVDVRVCSERWVGEVCAGEEFEQIDLGRIDVTSSAMPGTNAGSAESLVHEVSHLIAGASTERWLLMSTAVPHLSEGAVTLTLIARGASDEAHIDAGPAGTIAETGAPLLAPAAGWLGVIAIGAGLFIAGAAHMQVRVRRARAHGGDAS